MALNHEKLYNTYYLKVYSYVLRITKNPSVSEDITQNTFLKAMTTKETFRKNSSEFTWLCAIAKNLSYDYFREESKKTDLPEYNEMLMDDTSHEEEYILKETSFAIHKALHELAEPYKEVFELRMFGELSFSEISKIFGKTESWARVTYHRARWKIKERMDLSE